MGDGTRRLEYETSEVRRPASRLAMVTVVVSAVFVAASLLLVLVHVDSYRRSFTVVISAWGIIGLAAGVTGWHVRRRARRGRREDMRIGSWAKVLLVFGFVVGGLGIAGGMGGHYSRELVERAQCATNMIQIGSAILLYSNENQSRYPDRLEQLLLTQDISSHVFVCPGTNDVASQGPTAQVVADGLTAGGHLSYVYVGAGLTDHADSDTVVLYEPLANHDGQGMNVLFGDGHVDFLAAAEAREIVDRVAAGERPVIWKGPGVRPTTGPARK